MDKDATTNLKWDFIGKVLAEDTSGSGEESPCKTDLNTRVGTCVLMVKSPCSYKPWRDYRACEWTGIKSHTCDYDDEVDPC